MKRITLLLALLLGATAVMAQNRAVIDSIKALIPAEPDTSNTKDLYNLADQFFRFRAPVDSFKPLATQVLNIAKEYEHPMSFVRGYYLHGVMAYRNQDLDSSKIYFEKAYENLDTTSFSTWQVSLPNALGAVSQSMDNNVLAIRYFLKSMETAEKNGVKKGLPQAYGNLAISYGNMEEVDKSLYYFRKAKNLHYEMGNPMFALNVEYSMIALFSNIMQYDSAEFYALKVLRESEVLNYPTGIIRANKSLANIYAIIENFPQSIYHGKKVLELEKDNPNKTYVFNAYRALALSSAKLGYRKEAYRMIDSIYMCLEQIPTQTYTANAYENMGDIYEALGDYKKANDAFRVYYTMRDSLFGEEQRKKALNLQALYENEKKERELLELSHKAEKQEAKIKSRNQMLWLLGGITMLGLLSMYLIFRQKAYKDKEKILEAEQRLLRIQMNPHFLFNTLSSIQNYLFDKDDTKKALHYLARLSQLMRQVLEYGRETFISLEDEVETLKNYLSLQQLRHDDSFEYEIIIDESLSPWEVQVPPLMAQPFVENAIEHGKVHTVEGGKIWIRFQKDGEHLKLIVEDNGLGRERSKEVAIEKKHKSLATSITRDRLAVLGDLTKKKFAFNIIDLPQRGTKVEFELPVTEIA